MFKNTFLFCIALHVQCLIALPEPLGILLPVNGYKFHFLQMGESHHDAPPVILDTFLGGNLLEWSLIQPNVATFAHICSYDRAGLGWSEPSAQPRTSSCIVEELRALLQQAGIKPPYILVGHSSGGINMRLFANRYPEEVYGLILVDPSHEQQKAKIQALRDQFQLSAVTMQQDLSWLAHEFHAMYKQLQDNPTTSNTISQEREFFGTSAQELAQSINQLLDKPLTVITRGTRVVDQTSAERLLYERAFHGLWLQLQQDIVSKSKHGKQIIACGSGHMIQRERPDIVIEAIRDMVESYKYLYSMR